MVAREGVQPMVHMRDKNWIVDLGLLRKIVITHKIRYHGPDVLIKNMPDYAGSEYDNNGQVRPGQ